MSSRCAICHAEYPSAKGFHRRPVGKGRFELLCPRCADRQEEVAFHCTLALFAVMTVLGIVLFHRILFGPALLFFGTLFLTLVATVLPHELGHALAALAVGMRLFTVAWGAQGRILFMRQILGYDLVCRSILLGGTTLYTPKHLTCVRLRDFVAVLGGPLANGLIILLALGTLDRVPSDGRLYYILVGFVYGNVITLAVGLFPRKAWMGKDYVPNDGLHLLTLPFLSHASLEAWHSTTFYYEALESLQRGNVQNAERWLTKGTEVYPDNSWRLSVQASILEHQHKYPQARGTYLRALYQLESMPDWQAYLWNAIAWTDLMIADPALLEEAERFSRQAIEEVPWLSAIKGTRGSVLIELGRCDEGVRLVEQAFRENDVASQKALNACYLAIAVARQKDKLKAHEYLDKAKKWDLNCPLLERTIKEVQQR